MENTNTTFVEKNVDKETGKPLLSPSDIKAITLAELKRIRKQEKRAKIFAAQHTKQ